MPFAPEYVTHVLNENFEDAKAMFAAPLMAIHYAHLVMLASQRIISAEDAHAIRIALDSVSIPICVPRATTAAARTFSFTSSA